jgi:hypothetical protein
MSSLVSIDSVLHSIVSRYGGAVFFHFMETIEVASQSKQAGAKMSERLMFHLSLTFSPLGLRFRDTGHEGPTITGRNT